MEQTSGNQGLISFVFFTNCVFQNSIKVLKVFHLHFYGFGGLVTKQRPPFLGRFFIEKKLDGYWFIRYFIVNHFDLTKWLGFIKTWGLIYYGGFDFISE